MFENAEELRAHWDDKKERLEEEVELVTEAMRYLEVAYDYLEEVITERDDGDLLPSSASRDSEELFDRQMKISDRLGYRSEQLDSAQGKLDRFDEDLQWELEAHGFDEDGDTV